MSSSGSGGIAGSELDMAELDASSSGPVAVDLNLNLGPSFALELALRAPEVEESVPVSQASWNWPRFEPGILEGGQEDEVPPLAEPALQEDQQESARVLAVLSEYNAGSSSHAFGGSVGQRGDEPDTEVTRSLIEVLQSFRSARHVRHRRRPRQASSHPAQDLGQAQDSSEHGSTLETRALAGTDTAESLLLPGVSENDRMPSCIAFAIAPSPDSSNPNGKAEAEALVGSGFDCNICLEMATEPVVACCGHLFCWPCLYKWLHLHSSQKECPVCKGYLSDDAITPIYGRGSGRSLETSSVGIPPCPHAHRVNGKWRQLDRVFGELLDTGAAAAEEPVPMFGSQGETANAAERVFSRSRVAQRLQRDYIDDRFRMLLRQRLVGRRVGGDIRPRLMAALGTSAQASFVSTAPNSDWQDAENVPTHIAINHLETADSLAAIGARINGLREGLEHIQRTLDIVSTLPTEPVIGSPHRAVDAASSSVVWPLLNEERIAHSSVAESPRHLTLSSSHAGTSELPQTSRHRAVSDTAGCSDLEPDALHSRKRRRLN